ncbi:MAG TPA: hypothetical protein VG711_06145, partial [Phycisphaerales bacterium]|nr:hypothetical protein [Phycisphaerales bacterium]
MLKLFATLVQLPNENGRSHRRMQIAGPNVHNVSTDTKRADNSVWMEQCAEICLRQAINHGLPGDRQACESI